MKTFLFSIGALALMIVIIVCNAVYIKNVTGEMQRGLEELQSCDEVPSQALLARWRNEEKLLELSISATDMSEIANHLTELCVAARLEDKETFERARALCLCGIVRIRELERFSLLHIL